MNETRCPHERIDTDGDCLACGIFVPSAGHSTERKQILDDLAKAEERDGLYDRTPECWCDWELGTYVDDCPRHKSRAVPAQPPAPEPAKPIMSNNDYYKSLRGYGQLVAGNTPAAPEQAVSAEVEFLESVFLRHARLRTSGGYTEYYWNKKRVMSAITEAYEASPLRHEIATLRADRDSWRRTAEKLEEEIAALKEENERLRLALNMASDFVPDGFAGKPLINLALK